MSAIRQLTFVTFLCGAVGCGSSAPAPKVAEPVVEVKPVVAPAADFDKFAQAEVKRLNQLGFVTRDKFKHSVQKLSLPAPPVVDVLSIDVVRKGRPEGAHEVLTQAQRAKDNAAIARSRRQQGNPLAAAELAPKKYTLSEIAARTVFVIHLDLKYRPRNGTWTLYRGNTQVVSAKGLEDKDIALHKYVTGQRYIAWRLEDLERLF